MFKNACKNRLCRLTILNRSKYYTTFFLFFSYSQTLFFSFIFLFHISVYIFLYGSDRLLCAQLMICLVWIWLSRKQRWEVIWNPFTGPLSYRTLVEQGTSWSEHSHKCLLFTLSIITILGKLYFALSHHKDPRIHSIFSISYH